MVVLRVCYKNGVRFDEGYYASRHLPLVTTVFRPYGLTNVEVVKVTAAAGGGRPPYQVVFSAYFESESALQNALQGPRMGEVLGDIPNYHDGTPDILIGEVVAVPAVVS